MKMLLVKYVFLYFFLTQVHGKPQITKLFPVQEAESFHQQTMEIRPLDKFLGKLRATYDFIFRKPEDTSNVERILTRNEAAVDVNNYADEMNLMSTTTEDWWSFDYMNNEQQIMFTLDEPTDQMELQDGFGESEVTTPEPNNPPSQFHQYLIQWLGSLLALSYGIYAKFSAYVCN